MESDASCGSGSERRIGNLHRALWRCWHPVRRLDDASEPQQVVLLGQRWDLSVHDGNWQAKTGRHAAAATAVHLGMVWIAPESPITPLPIVPEAEDADFVAVPAPPWDWAAGAAQMTDGACDITHVPFLHRETIGDPRDAFTPPYEVLAGPWTATATYAHLAQALRGPSRLLPRHVTIEHTAPFCVRIRLDHPEEDTVLTSVFLHQPLSEAETRLWCVNYRTDIADGRCTEDEATALHRRVNDEDRKMLERYPFKELPLDLREEVHVRTDRITVELRRSLGRLIRAAANEDVQPVSA